MSCILFKNCNTFDINLKTLKKVNILIENNLISKISENIIDSNSEDTAIIDIEDGYIIPGMIDCHTHLGIIEEATGKIGVDNNEISNPVTPHLRAIDAINPFDIAFQDARKCGITTVMTGPGSNNAVGGQNIVIKTYGTIIDKMIVKNPSGLKIALGENPLFTYGTKGKCPVTRMGTAALIRELFLRTQDYIIQKENGKIKERDIQLEAVVPLLKGEISLRVHAHRADDIITAIRIADEFGIVKLVIEHGTEAHLVKEYLAQKKVPVAFGPMLTPRIKMEMKSRHYSSTLKLTEAGVKVSLITDHPYNSIDQLRTVMLIAIAEGMDPYDALNSVTINPAEILDCSNRIGVIKEGYEADLVIFNGSPFDITSKVIMTLIDGNIVYKRSKDEI